VEWVWFELVILKKSIVFFEKYTGVGYYVSMKMRLGYDTTEVLMSLPILEKYP
jgi:hypothetical protein